MADDLRPASNLAVVSTITVTDRPLVVLANGALRAANSQTMLSNGAFNVRVANLTFANLSTPANSTITCPQNTVFIDSSYIYVAIANNVLKRVALSSF